MLQNFRCNKSTLAQVVDKGMKAEGRKFCKEKGNLAVVTALEEAEKFMEKASETWKEDANLKVLKANRNRLLDFMFYVNNCLQEKRKE